jgi:hypothetical protein
MSMLKNAKVFSTHAEVTNFLKTLPNLNQDEETMPLKKTEKVIAASPMKVSYALMASSFVDGTNALIQYNFCCALQADQTQQKLNNAAVTVRKNKWKPADERQYEILRGNRFSAVSTVDNQRWNRIVLMSPTKPIRDFSVGDVVQFQDFDRLNNRWSKCAVEMTLSNMSDMGTTFQRGEKWKMTVTPGARKNVYKTLVAGTYHLNDLGLLIPEKELVSA